MLQQLAGSCCNLGSAAACLSGEVKFGPDAPRLPWKWETHSNRHVMLCVVSSPDVRTTFLNVEQMLMLLVRPVQNVDAAQIRHSPGVLPPLCPPPPPGV